MMQVQEQETHARRMEMGFTMQAIGDDLLSEEHCDSVRQARLDHHLIFKHTAEQVTCGAVRGTAESARVHGQSVHIAVPACAVAAADKPNAMAGARPPNLTRA